MKMFGFNLGKKIKISFNFEWVWDTEISNYGDRYLGLFTSRTIIHNWVTKKDASKFYEVLYRFGINLVWFKLWLSISNSKEYQYSIKTKKTKTEIYWDI
jgi:hypothetical protein